PGLRKGIQMTPLYRPCGSALRIPRLRGWDSSGKSSREPFHPGKNPRIQPGSPFHAFLISTPPDGHSSHWSSETHSFPHPHDSEGVRLPRASHQKFPKPKEASGAYSGTRERKLDCRNNHDFCSSRQFELQPIRLPTV